MKTGKKVIFSPIESYNLNTILRNYCDLLKSHYSNRYKLIINSCNNKLLSCHHLTTISHIEFSHPVCQFITYLMKEMPYSGLYCGIITSSYLSKILALSQVRPTITQIDIINSLKLVKDLVCLVLDQKKKKTELECHHLVSIVNSGLKTLSLEHSFAKRLAVSVVKASLLATDESSNKLGHISIKIVNGTDTCETYKGVLYKLGSLWEPKMENYNSSPFRLLLFIEPLEFVANNNYNITETILVNSIIVANIKIVACQKSIDKKIIFLLRRHNIFAIERLGEENTNALAQLSGAFPISDHNSIDINKWDVLAGVISTLTRTSINDENYLLMKNNDKKVVTIYVSHRSFDILDQLKASIKESLHAIYSVFKYPYFLPEDFDSSLAKQLIEENNNDLPLKTMMILFAESIREASPTELKAKLQRNDIYLIKRNTLAQAFSTVANILQVGLFIVKE